MGVVRELGFTMFNPTYWLLAWGWLFVGSVMIALQKSWDGTGAVPYDSPWLVASYEEPVTLKSLGFREETEF